MTPQTQKDLAELGMTPEGLAAHQRKIEAILHPNGAEQQQIAAALGGLGLGSPLPPAPPTRKPRSDKGVPKPKANKQDKAQQIKDAARKLFELRETFAAVQDQLGQAEEDFDALVDSLTAGK